MVSEFVESATEEWRVVASLGGRYEISSLGKMRNSKTKRIRKYRVDRYGYFTVMVSTPGQKTRCRKPHQFVAESFHGPCPAGYEVNHKNGNKRCNEPWNLIYAIHEDNMKHAFDTGLIKFSNSFGCLRKLNEDEKIQILLRNCLVLGSKFHCAIETNDV